MYLRGFQQTFEYKKLTMPSNVLPLRLKQTFPPIIWIFTEGEGDEFKSRLPFKILSTLITHCLIKSVISKKGSSVKVDLFQKVFWCLSNPQTLVPDIVFRKLTMNFITHLLNTPSWFVKKVKKTKIFWRYVNSSKKGSKVLKIRSFQTVILYKSLKNWQAKIFWIKDIFTS